MRTISTFVIILVLVYLIVVVINFFFFSKNNIEENNVSAYINNSLEMELDVPKDKSVTVDMKTIYTGIEIAFSRGKTKKHKYSTLTFYNQKHQKYFVLILDYGKIYVYSALALGQETKVRVNKDDFENVCYGTKGNPVPIFMMDIPQYADVSSFMEAKITGQQYQNMVYNYLSYMLSKEEFEDRFKNHN